jgi:hypothetical protein
LEGDEGLVIFEGRIKDLSAALSAAPLKAAPPTATLPLTATLPPATLPLPIQAALAALPRPNQAFWTLSALWAGWLWGRDAIGPFKSALHRRRYDWGWHTTALHTAFSAVAPLLPTGGPFFGLIGGAEPGFLSAALIGADLAGFQLEGLALRAEDGPAQFTWEKSPELPGARQPGQAPELRPSERGRQNGPVEPPRKGCRNRPAQTVERAVRRGLEKRPCFRKGSELVVQAAVAHLKASSEAAHYLSLQPPRCSP